jgi:hypothetical protein
MSSAIDEIGAECLERSRAISGSKKLKVFDFCFVIFLLVVLNYLIDVSD